MRSSFGSISRSVAVYVRRHHLALVALLVALGGTSYAATKIDSSEIARNAGPSSLYAGGPDGSQLAGVGGAWVDADANGCRFVVSAIG